jgi:general secretion pathway protein E
MGVERYNLSATVQAILAQRLLRRVCPSCAVPVEPSPGVGKLLAVHGMRAAGPILREAGCEQCGGTGYRGRLGCHEFLTMTPELKAAVNRAASEEELAEIAARGGMAGLMKDGLHKVLGRETTIAEVLRVLGGTIDD